jgi:hypothetical protein
MTKRSKYNPYSQKVLYSYCFLLISFLPGEGGLELAGVRLDISQIFQPGNFIPLEN